MSCELTKRLGGELDKAVGEYCAFVRKHGFCAHLQPGYQDLLDAYDYAIKLYSDSI